MRKHIKKLETLMDHLQAIGERTAEDVPQQAVSASQEALPAAPAES